MKAKSELALVALICTVPAFLAGWHWSHQPDASSGEPVRQVIDAIESGEETPPANLQTAAVFDSLHQRTVASFVNTFKSFGMARILKVDDMRHSDLWTLHPGRNDGFEVALIGLDRETPVRFQPTPRPDPAAGVPGDPAVLANLASSVPAEILNAEEMPLDRLDLAAIASLQESDGKRREIFTEHDSVIAYGPVRSSSQCLRCHDGDAGELLGVFRYTFPFPEKALRTQLAGTP